MRDHARSEFMTKWSEVPLTFSQRRRYPVVVKDTMHNIYMGGVLVDGGSSINLLFADELDALQIPSTLKPSPSFFGITNYSSVKPLGQIELSVTFGLPNNFMTERVLFDVVDFGTAYNAILGRPVLVQFMVIAHYAYQAIKIPSSKGAITILGNQKATLHCDKRNLDMVELIPGS
ncbi:uncharacterized protein LOC133927549 [Phragmites australis]|uniref:uncharacterized protein LOC133927549 n=1 Tax=Phragmites australis TaxID=29695 RepID=UPI002D785979|nr:uncharacterized protein LOC133927549 [Phragmites australis]